MDKFPTIYWYFQASNTLILTTKKQKTLYLKLNYFFIFADGAFDEALLNEHKPDEYKFE